MSTNIDSILQQLKNEKSSIEQLNAIDPKIKQQIIDILTEIEQKSNDIKTLDQDSEAIHRQVIRPMEQLVKKKTMLEWASMISSVLSLFLSILSIWLSIKSINYVDNAQEQITANPINSPIEEKKQPSLGGKVISFVENGKYGFKDSKGKAVIPPRFEHIQECFNSFWIVREGPLSGIVDTNGTLRIPPKYLHIGCSSPREVGFRVNNAGFWGITTIDNKILIPFNYESVSIPIKGLVKVKKNGKWGIMNLENESVIPFQYDDLDYPWENMMAIQSGGKWGLQDLNTKKMILPFAWDSILWSEYKYVHSNHVCVKKNGKWGLADLTGNIKIPCIYDEAFTFSSVNATVKVKKDGKSFGIDINNNCVANCE